MLGYSMGAGVAFRLAVQHPQMVRRLVLVSGVFAQNGFYPEMLPQQAAVGAGMMEFMKDTPMYQSYVAVSPKPEDFRSSWTGWVSGCGRRTTGPRMLRSSGCRLMLVYGDGDMIRLEHVVQVYQLLGGGLKEAGWQREHMSQNRLAIVPDLTHYEMFLSPLLASTVLPFLNGVSGAESWAAQVEAGAEAN